MVVYPISLLVSLSGLLDRSDCADIATTIVNYLKSMMVLVITLIDSILGREYSPEELEATENPVTITPGFPEKIKEQILEKEIPEVLKRCSVLYVNRKKIYEVLTT